jgi:hypothetical protein
MTCHGGRWGAEVDIRFILQTEPHLNLLLYRV